MGRAGAVLLTAAVAAAVASAAVAAVATAGAAAPPSGRAWALVVAASPEARHQNDAEAQARLLRRAGAPNSRIVLVLPRGGASVDHRGLAPADVTAVLTGRASRLLPAVLRPSPADTVYVYVAGHGDRDGVATGYPGRLTPELLSAALARTPHAAAVVAVEACNAGIFAERLRAPRSAVLAAAHADQFAYAVDERAGVWQGDEFSRALAGVLTRRGLPLARLVAEVRSRVRRSTVQLATRGLDARSFSLGSALR